MELSEQTVEKVLERFGVSNLKRFSKLPFGYENLSIKIETGEKALVLRQWTNSSLGNISFECSLMGELEKKGFPIPKQFPDKNGKRIVSFLGMRFGLFEFLDGEIIEPAKLGLNRLRATGKTLGEMHLALRNFSPEGKSKSSDLFDFKFDFGLLNKVSQSLISNSQLAKKVKPNIKNLENLLKNKRPALTGPIHNDFYYYNLKFKGGKINAVLDFGDSCIGAWVADLAATLSDTCFDSNSVGLQRARTIFSAYSKEVKLDKAELQYLPELMLHRALRVALFNLDAAIRFPSEKERYLLLFDKSIEISKALEEALSVESLF